MVLLAGFASLVALAVLALWLFVSPLVAGLVIVLSALGLGSFLATGIGADWIGTRGRSFFERDRR